MFWDSQRQEYTIQKTSLPSQRLVVTPLAITTFSRWFRSNLSHQVSSLTFNLPLIHLSRFGVLPQGVSTGSIIMRKASTNHPILSSSS